MGMFKRTAHDLDCKRRKAEADKAKLVEALLGSGGRFIDTIKAIEAENYATAKEYCQVGLRGNRAVLKEVE